MDKKAAAPAAFSAEKDKQQVEQKAPAPAAPATKAAASDEAPYVQAADGKKADA